MVSFVPVFVDYDFGDVFPAVPSVPSTDWEGGQSPLFPLFPCQACCMTQNQLDTYNNHVSDRTKAQPGVLIDGILQEESSPSSPGQRLLPRQDSCPRADAVALWSHLVTASGTHRCPFPPPVPLRAPDVPGELLAVGTHWGLTPRVQIRSRKRCLGACGL